MVPNGATRDQRSKIQGAGGLARRAPVCARGVALALALGVSLALALVLLVCSVRSAHAIDPGTAAGDLTFGDAVVPVLASSAYLHDNAEGILSRTPELRICITDREIDPMALRGLGFLPIEEMARLGQVRGLLFKLQPDAPDEVVVTMLDAAEPGSSLMSQTWVAKAGEFWSEFEMGGNRVSGLLEPDPETPWAASFPTVDAPVSFSAPLFQDDPVSADLQGQDARESAPFLALKSRMQSMVGGNWDEVVASATADAHAQMERMIEASGMELPQVVEMMKTAGADELKNLETIDRAVIRKDRAVLIYHLEDEGSQWQTLDFEDGVWKVAL